MTLGEGAMSKENDYQSTPKYWISHASYTTDCQIGESNQMCTISVVLDAGTHRFFSGIRIILVVCTGIEWLKDARIQERIEPNERHNNHRWPSERKPKKLSETYGTSLEKHRTRIETSNSILARNFSLNGHNDTLPLCTVVFELIDNSDDAGPSVGLKLRLDTASKAPLCVIYERAVACTSDRRGFVNFLQLTSDHSFRGTLDLHHSSLPSPLALASMPTHMVRVLPIKASPPVTLQLPLTIIRRITSFAFRQRERGFRRGLMSVALVCKAWLPVLDIFFEILGYPNFNSYVKDLPSAKAVARTLEWKPEKAKLIKTFRSRDYITQKDKDELVDAHITILSLATSVTDITISSIPPLLVDSFLLTASKLKGVRALTVFTQDEMDYPGGMTSNLRKPSFQLNTTDILKLISHWEGFRELRITRSRNADKSGVIYTSSDQFDASAQSHSCRIEELHLSHENISGVQILQLVSPSRPMLKELYLENISGVSNREFLSFLSYTSPTLVRLRIFSCDIPRDSDAEEYAVDAVMPQMVSLNRAILFGQASVLAIARKPQAPKTEIPHHPWHDMTLSVTFTDNTYDLSASDVVGALQTTGWKSIMITHPGESAGPNSWDILSYETVHRVAKERGLDFVIY
ncbi:hypothetical protein BDZ94DRAFT_1267785 [Collybia nuda]|uniref:Uncharacterized protein n=1 Tax=Collybia nuda TaxID=64659 RepID=A0A9P5XXQ4_9AGAR|nr:hypothetical protein BDZ94DRAFT_1267785 [Collybia nuda]